MTREPFIAHSELTNEIYIVVGKEKYRVTEQAIRAVMAIKALEQEPFNIETYCKEHFVVMVDKDIWEKAEKALNQEPCEDAISRQAVLEVLRSDKYDYVAIYDYVKKLPSVKPQEPKTGHWIRVVTEVSDLGDETWHYECSECGACSFALGDDRFCHHCGAEMKEGDA